MRRNRLTELTTATALLAALTLAGCSDTKPNPTPANFMGLGSGSPGDPSTTRMGGDDSGVIFGIGKGAKDQNGGGGGGPGAGIGVNAFLWRGALDTIAFMPLSSADPFGGVIITDWYAPPSSPDERFKITIYILDRRLNATALKAAVFRQTKDSSGNWIDAAVDPATSQKLEDEILTRARELRIASTEAQQQSP
jgi:hypothetical protein